jgi:Asp-tRNA(Asn)/Glu-tRNA(Gln) amidotransferase B subunit
LQLTSRAPTVSDTLQTCTAKAKPTMLGWFVGQVMKASGGKANPAAVNTS